MPLHLQEVSTDNEEILAVLHRWSEEETHHEWHTCRPVTPVKNLDEYIQIAKKRLERRTFRIFVLVNDEESPCGKVTAFDYNPRNQSAEFGYYLPQIHRGKGYGSSLLDKFISSVFQNEGWQLNKLYATTASGNAPSVKLLERFGFHLDGVLREHYWIGNHVQDQLHYSLLKREYIC